MRRKVVQYRQIGNVQHVGSLIQVIVNHIQELQDNAKWVHQEPKIWKCLACRQNKKSDHPEHLRIDGQCRHGPNRLPRLDGGRTRGKFPVDARTPTTREPTAGLRIGDEAQDAATGLRSLQGATGTLVNPEIVKQEADAEEEMLELARERSVAEGGSSSSDHNIVGQEIPQEDEEGDPEQAEDAEEEDIGPEDAVVSQSRRRRKKRSESTQAGQ